MRKKMTFVLLLALAFCLPAAGMADGQSFTLSGTNTVRYHNIGGVRQGDVLEIDVAASGRGSNLLRIEVQQNKKRGSSRWKNIGSAQLRMPSGSTTFRVTVEDLHSNTLPWFGNVGPIFFDETVRIRVSRSIGSKRVFYTLNAVKLGRTP